MLIGAACGQPKSGAIRGRVSDARAVSDRWPCPCCGYRTLREGPGDYDLCPVCFWEDDGSALRWPLLEGGPNGISLIEAQRRFAHEGFVDDIHRRQVRRPRADESRDPGWRPLDPEVDDFERDPENPDNLPWPEDGERLYWWRSTYFRLPDQRGPVPAPPRSPDTASELLMTRILHLVPETGPIDIEVRRRWEAPAPFRFCDELAPFVRDAHLRGEHEIAARVLALLEEDLAFPNGEHPCVTIAFLEHEFWTEPELADFIANWPPRLRDEIRRLEHRRTDSEGPWLMHRPLVSWAVRHPVRWWRSGRGRRFAG